MLLELLTPTLQKFIHQHEEDDLTQFLLKYKSFNEVPASIIVDQISGRKKAKEKLPSWFKNDQIIFPPSINIEQSSSEQTAKYKVEILRSIVGNETAPRRMADFTGGFGVDSFFLAPHFDEAYFVEANANLIEIATHNHRVLGNHNLHYYNTSAEEFLEAHAFQFDLVYIDPSRRSKGNQKVFSFNQCEPNVALLQEKIWRTTEHLLVKASPLLDLQQGLKELTHVKKVYVIALENECKELLFLCQKNFDLEPTIEAIDIKENTTSLTFLFSEERSTTVSYSDPLKYLYEPNAAILKSGAFKTVAARLNILKIHPNTHLYTAENYVSNFPGRTFEIESLVKDDPKTLRQFFPEGKANVAVRNYSSSVDDLRKKTKLKNGGDKFLIGFSGMKRKFLAVANKLDNL